MYTRSHWKAKMGIPSRITPAVLLLLAVIINPHPQSDPCLHRTVLVTVVDPTGIPVRGR
jgi:hypothetical protein